MAQNWHLSKVHFHFDNLPRFGTRGIGFLRPTQQVWEVVETPVWSNQLGKDWWKSAFQLTGPVFPPHGNVPLICFTVTTRLCSNEAKHQHRFPSYLSSLNVCHEAVGSEQLRQIMAWCFVNWFRLVWSINSLCGKTDFCHRSLAVFATTIC